jgi:hypothetical protein
VLLTLFPCTGSSGTSLFAFDLLQTESGGGSKGKGDAPSFGAPVLKCDLDSVHKRALASAEDEAAAAAQGTEAGSGSGRNGGGLEAIMQEGGGGGLALMTASGGRVQSRNPSLALMVHAPKGEKQQQPILHSLRYSPQ